MAFGISKSDDSLKTINDLRLKMEKMRIENTLLRDQIRAILTMPPELSSIYIIIQNRNSACFEDLRKNPKLASLPEELLIERINSLINMGVLEVTSKNDVAYFSAKSPDMAESWSPVKEAPEGQYEPEAESEPEPKVETGAAAPPAEKSGPEAKSE